MASDVARIERKGDRLAIYHRDGTIAFANLYPNGQWVVGYGTAPSSGGSGSGVTITADMIAAAVQSVGGSTGNMVDSAANIAKAFNDAIALVDPTLLSSKNRAACLIGQCAEESGWFQTTTEYGGGVGYSYYPYCGRGFIQVTGVGNYRAFGQWCVSKGLLSDADYFVNNITALADLKWAALTAIWYFSKTWGGKTLWQLCDEASSPWYDIGSCINWGEPGHIPYGASERATATNAVLAITPDPGVSGSDAAAKVAAWIISKEGAYYYTQGAGRLTPDQSGGTDCSALMWYAYKNFAGIEIGQWTGGQQGYGTIVQEGTGALTDRSKLRVGDLVFFNWSYPTATFDHVEMYIGSGKFGADTISGHGGNPYYGPVQKSLAQQTSWAAGGWRVRRYL